MSECAAPRIHPTPTREEIRQLVYVTRCQLARAHTFGYMPEHSLKVALDALTRLQADLTPETDD